MRKLIKSILLIALVMLIAGCSSLTQNFTSSKKVQINQSLPVVSHTSIRTIPDIQSIALEWKGFTIPNVYGYHIYRSNLQIDGENLIRVATINNKYASHYLDKDLKENTSYLYSIAVIGKEDTQSNPSKPIRVNTLELFDSISFSIAIGNLPRQVKILWRPHTNKAVKYYKIQRNDQNQEKWKTIKKVQNRLNAEYIDTNLKDDFTYAYRIIAVTFDGIESKVSQIVSAKTKSLPKSTNKITASDDIARKIIVSWKTLADDNIMAYNIYSSRSSNGYFSKIAQAKRDDNTFEDILNQNNVKRYYKITTVDKDGLETNKDTLPIVVGKTLALPLTPQITLAQIKGQKVIINWDTLDNRARYFNIHKTVKEGLFKSKTKIFKKISSKRFEDKDIVRGVIYEYELESVDENNLVSNKTKAITLNIPILNKDKRQK